MKYVQSKSIRVQMVKVWGVVVELRFLFIFPNVPDFFDKVFSESTRPPLGGAGTFGKYLIKMGGGINIKFGQKIQKYKGTFGTGGFKPNVWMILKYMIVQTFINVYFRH